jgi:amylosucrase
VRCIKTGENIMPDQSWIDNEATKSLARLTPRLESIFEPQFSSMWPEFKQRLDVNFERLFGLFYHLYANRYDFFFHLEDLVITLAHAWINRPVDLKSLDIKRENEPAWFQSNKMLGGVCYVDLFAGTLSGLREKIPYFQELELTYLHLMPLFKAPEGDNDGGYAVSSYREVEPALGSIQELSDLAGELRQAGISLVVDLVFNHTSDEHRWALQAKAGNQEYEDFYHIYPDRKIPDAYEAHLREIFPDEHPGAFTHRPDLGKWIWTTFHSYQWDLNYSNPEVFNRMAEEMLFLANAGVEVLRLDAVAFIWKQLGTGCENLEEAHLLIQAFNVVARIAAPALLFKSEAIVHPDDVIKYISLQECQISYNPLLMALLWNSLATREVRLLRTALGERFQLPDGCAWVNYIRCHDDIGWTFSDDDAARLGINGYDHRRFLNSFFTGRFEGSFACGLPFQENPKTGDARISGTAASLAGLEKALVEETDAEIELAVRRIVLLNAIILTIGGIPLIYLGDEIGTLNDYGYRNDPSKARDSRWVHRPKTDWTKVELRNDPASVQGRIYQNLLQWIRIRKEHEEFSGSELEVIQTGNDQVLGFVRLYQSRRLLIFANFSEDEQLIPGNVLRLYGLGYEMTDLITGLAVKIQDRKLSAYDVQCLMA